MEFIKLKSNAKINLTLDVLAKREDGYHELEMIMQNLSLYDSIYIRKRDRRDIKIKSNLPYLPTDERNIAYKAAKVMIDKFKIQQGVYIEIIKRVPVAAGLAGGSGNCAAVLTGMNKLFCLGLSIDELMEIGSSLGSDVPYCILGGTALAKGKGDILTSLSPCPHFYVVLAKPKKGVSTAFVYQNLNVLNIKKHPDTKQMIEAINQKNNDKIADNLCNVLEEVTMKYEPIVYEIKAFLESCKADGALMSGSGTTVFALFKNKGDAQIACKRTKERFKLKEVYLTEIEGNWDNIIEEER